MTNESSRLVPWDWERKRTQSGTFADNPREAAIVERTPRPLLRVGQTGEFVLGPDRVRLAEAGTVRLDLRERA